MSHEQKYTSLSLDEVNVDEKEGSFEPQTAKLLGVEALKSEDLTGIFDFDEEDDSLFYDELEFKQDYTAKGWKPDVYQLAYYANSPEDYNVMRRGDGVEEISEVDFQRVLGALSADEKNEFDLFLGTLRKEEESAHSSQERIHQQAPYLYQGILPIQFMDRLSVIAPESRKEGKYAILINQSGQVDIEEATNYLVAEGGIELGSFYGIAHRFIAIPGHYMDPKREDFTSIEEYLENSINNGYYSNSNIGRFVVYAPLNDGVESAGELGFDESYPEEPGLTTPGLNGIGEKTEVVKGMYVYCFIDGEGTVWVNNNYLLSDKPDFVSSESAWL
jgi:hypothetical protein